jgi:lipid A 3-O-deacylase
MINGSAASPMKLRLAFLLALLCIPLPAPALDSVAVEAGRGTGKTTLLRVGMQWHGRDKWFEHSRWHIARYLDLAFGGWNNGDKTVYDLGLTPVFRFERSTGSPYLEAAIGFHAVSALQFARASATSTHFQFGDHIGVGFVEDRYDWGLRVQHLSNGGIRNPNPGINFLQVRVQYLLD